MSMILRQDGNMQALDRQAREYSEQPDRFVLPLAQYEERITGRGLAPVGDLGADEFLFLGFYIHHRHKALTWAWADWLNIAMTRYGEAFEQLAIHFKYQDDDWLSRLARTAAFYEQGDRKYDVSITHYAEAATRKLDNEQREALLQEAASEKLTVGAFREKIAETTAPESLAGEIIEVINQIATIRFETKTLQFDLNRGNLFVRASPGVKVFVKFTQEKDGAVILKELRPWRPPPQQFNYTGPADMVAKNLEALARRIRDEYTGQRVSADGKISATIPTVIDNQKQ